jgi:2Fe-2S ferredoxin
MPKITILPHDDLCPEGMEFDAAPGGSLCDLMHAQGIEIEHACEKACVCTTCHVIVRDGFSSLRTASDEEEDQLGKAWGLEPTSRLSCQAKLGQHDLVIEIPRYNLNFARENA